MSKQTYHPERGDLILVNFQPSAGREMDKRRPALVLSPKIYNRKTGFCVAAPISSDRQQSPFYLDVPAGLLDRQSQVLCDRLKSIDYRERSAVFLAKAPDDLVAQVVDTLIELIDPA